MPPHKQQHRRKTHKRKTQKQTQTQMQKRLTRKQQKKQKGGFLPSIGEPFVAAAAKYIAPLALFGLYRFLNPKKGKGTSGTRRRSRS